MTTRRTKTTYYKTGDICRKIFNADGFNFQLRVKKRVYSAEIAVLDHEGSSTDGLLVSGENDLYTVLDILKQNIHEWIENNTDEQDRLINLVTKWQVQV